MQPKPTNPDDEIADEDLIDPATVIEPPPEMKTIIEKTVSFVVKNGIEFESKVRDSQRSNRKFDFLNPGHAFHNYYKQKYQIHKYPKAAALAEKYQTQKALLHSSQQSLLGIDESKKKEKINKKKTGVITHKLTLKQRIMQQFLLHSKPKPEYICSKNTYNKFIVPLPTRRITAYEIDVIKLVSQFTAVHGKSFIRDLQRGEPENETFGFLSPMHPRFQYFQRLIDSYSSIIDEFNSYSHKENNFKNRELNFNLDRDKIWYEAIGLSEWTNREREKEAKYLLNEENERRANALIDWQAFTVLDTIDFDDDGNFQHLVPPGKTIEEIDAILESTIDVEADINNTNGILGAHDDMDMDMDISDQSQSDDDDDIEIVNNNNNNNNMVEIEMATEDNSELHRKQIAKAKAKITFGGSKPMPAPKGVIVSTDLDIIPTKKMETEQDIELRLKLEKILNDSRTEQLENQLCPICGEYINIKHLSQHIRIELLDPKWKEQKESLKLKLSQTTFASNKQISENLTRFNQAANPVINAKQNTNNNTSDIIPWNGHKDSLKQQKKLKEQENKLKELKKKQIENNNKDVAVTVTQQPPPPQPQYPPIPTPMQPPHAHAHARAQQQPMHGQYINPMIRHFRPPPGVPPHMLPPHHPLHRPPPFGIIPPPHGMRRPMPPPPQPPQQAYHQSIPQQPPAKKMKLNNNDGGNGNNNNNNNKNKKQPNGLIDEGEFIKQNGGVGKQFKIRIKVPKDDKKKQFNFNGQMLNFTMQLNQNINELKQRIFNVLSLPMNKQKLRIQTNGIWVKDINSLAFYNINGNDILELSTRTRGGKKNK